MPAVAKDGDPKRYKYFNAELIKLRKLEPEVKKAHSQYKMFHLIRTELSKFDGGTTITTYMHNKFNLDYDSSKRAFAYNSNTSESGSLKLDDARRIVLYCIKYHKHVASNHRWEARSLKNHNSQRRSRMQSFAKHTLTKPWSSLFLDWCQGLINKRAQQLKK